MLEYKIIIIVIVSFILGILIGYYFKLKVNKIFSKKQINQIIYNLLLKNNYFKQSKLILFLINLDNFHGIIEAFGYDLSNNILDIIYTRLKEYSKLNRLYLYRLNFDEYIIFSLGEFFDDSKIINEACKLLNIVADPLNCENNIINVTASIGISTFPDGGGNTDNLLRNAELALQDAKKLGRNTYSFYTSGLVDKLVDRVIIKNDLLTALHNNELQLEWQPQIDLSNNSLVGAEALIRWQHVVRGAISPEVFISIAESTGLISQVGDWIINNACKQCKIILEECNIKNFKIAINLSSGQFLQGDVVKDIAQAIYDAKINPNNFEVEITESMFIRDPEKYAYMLSVLSSMGINIAIDDFGTGYSSFGRLIQLNFDYLKIDQSFIKNINYDPKNYAIVCAIIAMAKSLNIKTIVEGIETIEQLELLKKIGCDFAQGYLISKPLALPEFIMFAKNYK